MSVLHASPHALSFVYNGLWVPALPIALLATGGRDSTIRAQRLGRLTMDEGGLKKDGKRVWVHAASVGEVEAVRPVLARLMHERPELQIVMTAMTATGCDAARRRIPGLIGCQLAPLDFRAGVRSFIEALRPHLILIAETELWPNFFREGARTGARIVLINGRLSARSMRRYLAIRPLVRHTLAFAEKIFVQTEGDAERFCALGAPIDRVVVTGNTKFDFDESPTPLRPELAQFAAGRQILLAGSTAPGEEHMVIEIYRNLLERFPDLALVIAPRHLERSAEIERDLREEGLPYFKASAPVSDYRPAVLLLDTMGELRAMYYRATIAFVGGSMNPPRGGQSMAEPAAASVPILFGPHHENQRQIANALIAENAAVVVNDGAEMETQCAAWLADEAIRRSTGQAARQVIERLAYGATATVEQLRPILASI